MPDYGNHGGGILYVRVENFITQSFKLSSHLNDASSFSAENNGHVIDIVYYLQNFPGGWDHGSGDWEKAPKLQECTNPPPYRNQPPKVLFEGQFWSFSNVRSKDVKCLSVQSTTKKMADFLESVADKYKSFMLDR